jgi:NAD(P)H-dependent nitrite reductase small subunit
MEEFKKVCSYSDLKDGIGKKVFAGDVEIALYKVDEKVYAVSNVCPHQHTHLIHEGYIEKDNVVCPVHGWMFNLQTGKMPKGNRGLDCYEVEIKDDDVYVKAANKELNW